MRRRLPWKLLLAFAVVLGLLVAARLLPLKQWLVAFPAWVRGQGALGMALFVVVYAGVTVLMGPAWLLTVAAGLTWGFAIAFPLVSVSATVGASIAFLLGRFLLRRRVEAAAQKNAVLRAVDGAVARKGGKIVFLLRLSPLVPYVLSNYVYGLTAIRFWPYVLASFFGMMPITALYVAGGAAGKDALEGRVPDSPWTIAVLVAGALVTIGVTVWVTRLARRELDAARGAGA